MSYLYVFVIFFVKNVAIICTCQKLLLILQSKSKRVHCTDEKQSSVNTYIYGYYADDGSVYRG